MAKISLISLYDKGCLGIRYISAALKQAGHKTSIIYLSEHGDRIKKRGEEMLGDDSWEGINSYGATHVFSYSGMIGATDKQLLIDLLKELKPDLIGFGLRTMSLKIATELVKEIKKYLGVPVIFGGIAVSTDPEECIKHADMICIGDGEAAIAELANRIDRKQPCLDVANIWVKSEGKIYKNQLAPLQQNLDNIPFPDHDAEDKFFISKSTLIRNYNQIGNLNAFTYEILTSRGCPFACSYCSSDLLRRLYNYQPYLRKRSPANVIDELKRVKKTFNIQTVMFRDDIFTCNLKWIEEFARKYREEINLPFWCFTHPNFADVRILKILKEIGLFSITMGIQSGSENTLYNIFNRRTPVEKIIESARILEELRLPTRPRFDIITDNPFETDQDREKTLELLMRLQKPVNFGMTKLSIIPGSKICQMAIERKIPRKTNSQEKKYNFWNYLYLLNQYRAFPNSLIKALKKSSFLRRHPEWIQLLLLPKRIEYYYLRFRFWLARKCPPALLLILKKIRYLIKSY